MVHVQINWYDANETSIEFVTKENSIWFNVIDNQITLIMPTKEQRYKSPLFGCMKFTPMQAAVDFYDTAHVSNIGIELMLNGVEETFAVGSDVETLAKIALERKNAPDADVERWLFTAIALYEVSIHTQHDQFGNNDSTTFYELLGILDNAKLPLALKDQRSLSEKWEGWNI